MKRPLSVLATLGVVGVGLWSTNLLPWQTRTRHTPLIGEVGTTNVKPSVERIVPPGLAVADAAGSAKSQAPALAPVKNPAAPAGTPSAAPATPATKSVEQPAVPTTQPTVSQPAVHIEAGQIPAEIEAGLAAKEKGELLAARDQLNRALHAGVTPEQAATCRQALDEIANKTIFSPTALPGDPLVESYTVQPGNSIGRLARRYKVSEAFIADVNNIKDRRFIREGARLKLVRGPFHASISKSEHLMHIYLQDVYVKTYRVALGADGKTPTGKWRAANHQENPGWVDPRTGKRWHPDDPSNPIGEYWIGLEGIEGAAVGAFGYGVHGTTEPETIGKDVSLGCVRLAPDDIAAVYKLLLPGESIITITD
jgi:LysM repeat protein